MTLHRALGKAMAEKDASDLFISVGSPISIKILGTIMPVNQQVMDAESVRKIAFDHDGDVGLEERPGGGARFVITLPLRVAGRAPRLSFVTFSGSSGRASTT